ncbi:MAG: TonB-dependent receptor [Flavicella sp.]
MKRSLVLLFFCIVTLSFTLYVEGDFITKVRQKLLAYESENFPEKIYIQTDKPYYSLDEDIWFSSYLVNGINHSASTKSKILYVELINENDSIVSKKKLYTHHMSAAGDFKISKDWNEGDYLIRAYTNAMRNEDASLFFQKEISILSPSKKDSLQEVSTDINKENKTSKDKERATNFNLHPEIKFYPEGGNLVNGLKNIVALKIHDKHYYDERLSGTLYETGGKEIFTFKTLPYGMGLFNFTPKKGKEYYVVMDINGAEELYNLPKAIEKGYSLQASNNGSHIVIDVASNTEKGLLSTYLVGHQRGKLLFERSETKNTNKYTVKIATTELQDGVCHLTLFNQEGNPVCERLIYVDNPNNYLKLDIQNNTPNLAARQKANFHISVKNKLGTLVTSSLSMAVRDMTAVPYKTTSKNIKTWLLLNSDLRGEVEDPGYFFSKENDVKQRYLLDLVMMTNGWRRFTWTSLLDEEKPTNKFPIEKGIFISGRTKNLKKPYDFMPAATRLSILGNGVYQDTLRSSKDGNFSYGPFVFFDSIPILLEARKTDFNSTRSRDRNLLILVDPPADSPKVSKRTKRVTESEDFAKSFLKINQYIEEVNQQYETERRMLDEVTIKAEKEEALSARDQAMFETTGYGEPSGRMVMEDINGANSLNLFDLLRRMNGVFVNGTEVTMRGGAPAVFYLDGMEIEAEFLEDVSGSEISFIDILKGSEASMFANGGNGVVALYSNTGNLDAAAKYIKRKPGIIDFKGSGFYTAREFYAPNHLEGFEEMMKADIRTTLHWEPSLRSKATAPTPVSFFTSDSKGDFIIEIEGISDNGTPIHGWTTFTVE